MNTHHQIILPPDMPRQMRLRLKRLPNGTPVPYFVAWVDGKPDFRIMSPTSMRRAIRQKLCWVCGAHLDGGAGAFVAGPMCVINRTSAEPPNHLDCAIWSAKACPFLTMPKKVRRETNIPGELAEPPGFMIARNPGVTAIIRSHSWRVFDPRAAGVGGGGGVLWNFDIDSVSWMAEGRDATDREILESVESGVPALSDLAERQGVSGALAVQLADALSQWFPDIKRFPAADFPNIIGALSP